MEPPPLSRFFQLARKEALKSTQHFRLGCLIVRKGKILGRGYNKTKHNPRLGSGFANFMHAESSALLDAFGKVKDLTGCVAYIYRRGGLNARPCSCCMSHLKNAGIKRIYYTVEEGFEEEKI